MKFTHPALFLALLLTSLALPFNAAFAQDKPATNGAANQAGPHQPRPLPARHDPSRLHTDRESRIKLEVPDEKEMFTFVVFGDRTGGPAEGIKVLEQAVKDTNLLQPDLVMTVGDLIQGYNQTPEWMEEMREFKGVMDNLLCPWFPVAGNHDVYWRGPNKPEGEHEKNYEMHFGPLWYAFEHKDCWFIVLYSDEGDEQGNKTFSRPEAQRMSDEQFNWLKGTLKKAKDAQHVFLFLHHPRWRGGRYGDDWNKVHKALVEAGNVRSVFAGHVHHMSYDGVKDGIEYSSLATVGGGQSGHVPEAGWLHQFHVVTVRQDQIAMAALPVGETMDPRAITLQVTRECAQLRNTAPRFKTVPMFDEDSGTQRIEVELSNPSSKPVDATIHLESADSRWLMMPDHQHYRIKAGETKLVTFDVMREPFDLDRAFRQLELVVSMDYLLPKGRVGIPATRTMVPMRIKLPPAKPAPREQVVALDGDDAIRIPSTVASVPDGPITLECWFKADKLTERNGIVTKTEGSEFGIFVINDVLSFDVHLNGSYVSARAEKGLVKTGKWYHVAGVFDGKQVRLYLDGKLVGSKAGSGKRTTNSLPLYIGADVSRRRSPMSHLHGQIDAVRLSTTARYDDDSFEPKRRHQPDDDTTLLFNFDQQFGPFFGDESASMGHGSAVGNPQLVPAQ